MEHFECTQKQTKVGQLERARNNKKKFILERRKQSEIKTFSSIILIQSGFNTRKLKTTEILSFVILL